VRRCHPRIAPSSPHDSTLAPSVRTQFNAAPEEEEPAKRDRMRPLPASMCLNDPSAADTTKSAEASGAKAISWRSGPRNLRSRARGLPSRARPKGTDCRLRHH
jgi:hypothetical protein